MINLSRLALSSGARADFVGIIPRAPDDAPYFTPQGDEPVTHTFHLPQGFEGFGVRDDQTLDYEAVKGLFFSLYRGFNRFVREQPERARGRARDRQDLEDQRRQGGGLGASVVSLEESARYSALTELTEVLLALPELNVTRLERPPAPVDYVDYGRLYKYLDRCVYLEDDAAYIDWMNLPRRELRSGYSELLGMYCFILDSVLVELDDDVRLPGPNGALIESIVMARRHEITSVADQFRDRHLSASSQLFSEEGCEHVTLILEELLAEIDQVTALRDRDFHTLFEACERFLYGSLDPESEGSAWGLSSFSLFWEDLCHTWLFSSPEREVLYADCDLPKSPRLINARASRSGRERVGNLKLGKSGDPRAQSWVYIGEERWSEGRHIRFAEYGHTLHYKTEAQRARDELIEETYDAQSLLSVTHHGALGDLTREVITERHKRDKRGRGGVKRSSSKRRLLRPDLVSTRGGAVEIWDFKYVAPTFFERASEKLTDDVSKSLAYEAALGGWMEVKRGANRFLIPLAPDARADSAASAQAWPRLSRGVSVWSLDLCAALRLYVSDERADDAPETHKETHKETLREALPERPLPRSPRVDLEEVRDLISLEGQPLPELIVDHHPRLTARGAEEVARVHEPVQRYLRGVLSQLKVEPSRYIPYHRSVDLDLDLQEMSFHRGGALAKWLEREVFSALGARADTGELELSPALMITLDDDCAPLTCRVSGQLVFGDLCRVGALTYGPATRPSRLACLTIRIHPFWLFDLLKGRRR